MKRTFLVDLGLESGVIEQIMKEHGKTVARKLEVADEERESLQKEIDVRDKQIKDLKDNVQLDDETKKKLSDYEAENNKLKEERKNILMDSAIKVAVAKEAFNPNAILKMIDREGLEVKDDGTIEGLEEKISALKESDSYLFTADSSIETPPNNDSQGEPEQTPPNNLNPGGQQGNGGKENDPSEVGKAIADKLFGKN